MAPRPSWKGYLRLSLVTVPVRAFTAAAPGNEVRLNQLHGECNNRIKYQKSCPEHGVVPNDEIVSGYEYSKGQYVVVDTEEVSKLRPESDRSIRIDGFIESDSLDPVYLTGRTYYLLPEGAVGQKPYSLLFRAMVDQNVHAMAQVVISGREQVVLVKPLERLLAMCVLHHDNKVSMPDTYHDELEELDLAEEELSLTKTLIDASRIGELDYSKYEDVYAARLTQLIRAKIDGQEIVQVADPEEPKILNLMEALKKSVAQAKLG